MINRLKCYIFGHSLVKQPLKYSLFDLSTHKASPMALIEWKCINCPHKQVNII